MDTKKILVVEDEEAVRFLISEKLHKLGYEVYQACDGEEALKLAREVLPDIIVTDIMMPKKDGNQLIKELRACDQGKTIPFIILTARTHMRMYFEAIEVDAFIEKPFDMDELVAYVELAFSRLKGLPISEKSLEKIKAIEAKVDPLDMPVVSDGLSVNSSSRKDFGSEESKQSGVLSGNVDKDRPAEAVGNIPVSNKNKIILILERDVYIFHELQKMFSKYKYDSQVVLSSYECVEEAKRNKPDLIILRNIIGEVNAEELAHNIKVNEHLKQVPIIVYSNIGQRSEGKSASSGSYFVLNEEGKALINRVRELLQ